jgi:tetratricopeptide (TPR) repeat protein
MRRLIFCMRRLMLVAVASVVAGQADDRLQRGMAAARRGDCNAAVPDLRGSLAADSRLVPAINALAVCEAQLGHPDEAVVSFERVVKLEPGVWQGWSNLGAGWLSASHPERAVEPLRRAVKLSPAAPSAWFHLGLAYRALEQPAEAFRALDRAQQLAPEDGKIVQAWLDSAGTNATQAADLIEHKEYRRARELLAPLARPLEKSGSWHNLLGYAEFKLGHPEPALDHLQKAIALEPDNEDYLLDMGEFLGHYRASKHAVEIFEVASRRLPNSVRVQLGLAVSYILLDRRDEAVAILEPLLASHSDYEPAYRALGECYEDAGNWEYVRALGKKLQVANPSNELGWYFEGAGLLRKAAEADAPDAEAIALLERASDLAPSSDRIHFILAKAYQQAGRDEQAIRQLKTTIRLNPQHERAHYVLARIYQKRGQTELAKQEMALHSKIKVQDRTAQYRSLLITSRNP